MADLDLSNFAVVVLAAAVFSAAAAAVFSAAAAVFADVLEIVLLEMLVPPKPKITIRDK